MKVRVEHTKRWPTMEEWANTHVHVHAMSLHQKCYNLAWGSASLSGRMKGIPTHVDSPFIVLAACSNTILHSHSAYSKHPHYTTHVTEHLHVGYRALLFVVVYDLFQMIGQMTQTRDNFRKHLDTLAQKTSTLLIVIYMYDMCTGYVLGRLYL